MTKYDLLSKKQKTLFNSRLAQYGGHLTWTRPEIEAHQLRSLRKLLHWCKERSSYYRDILDQVDIDHFQLTHLNHLPCLTKSILMERWNDIVCVPGLNRQDVEGFIENMEQDQFYNDSIHVLPTSGSLGIRGIFIYDWEAWPLTLVGSARRTSELLTQMSLDAKDCVQVQVSSEKANHMTSSMWDTFFRGEDNCFRLPVHAPIKALVSQLNQLQPDVLSCYPSILRFLCEQVRSGQLKISPRLILSNSEPLTPSLRQQIKKTWTTSLLINIWGSTEGGVMGMGCGRSDGVHLNEDFLIIEPLEQEIAVTNLYNHALPLVRYVMSDSLKLSTEACPCGSSYLHANDISGRTVDNFVYPGYGLLMSQLSIGGVIDQFPQVVQFQAKQLHHGVRIDMMVSQELDVNAVRIRLTDHLQKIGIQCPEVLINIVDTLPQGITGKLRQYVPL